MNDLQLPELKRVLNFHFDSGRRTLTRRDLASVVALDPALAHLVLRQWHARGWIRLIAPVATAAPDEICVELRSAVDHDRPFSDPASGKM